VFGDYLNYFSEELTRSREEAVNFLVFTLELPDSAAGRGSAESVVDIFRQASADISNATLLTDIANYCPGGTEVRTNEEIFEVMDQQDEEYVRIAEEQYVRTLAQLNPKMQAQLRTRIAKHKKSYAVAALNHKEAWEAAHPSPDMRAIVTDICTDLLARRDGKD
jgi:hypothetical protein